METARRLASLARQTPYDALYSSPLRRARQTADATAQLLGMTVAEDARLMEIHQGEWTGKDYRAIVAGYSDPIRVDGLLPGVGARAPGGESVAEVAERVYASAHDIAAQHPTGRVLVFTHGLALATLVCRLRGIPLSEVYEHIPRNGEITVLKWDIPPGQALNK